jgi:chromatin segregation and condensation protein Rec8/ScpA/Scc1 (kleisin family)
VASCSPVSNSTVQILAIKEAKALHHGAVVVEVSAEIETEKLMRAQKKESKEANVELKKKKAMEALALKREELMPELLKHVATKGMEHMLLTLTNPILKHIVTFLAGVQGLHGLSKSEVKSKIIRNWSAIMSVQSSPEEPTGEN